MLTSIHRWLLEACDPEHAGVPAGLTLSAAELAEGLDAARRHGVLGAALRSADQMRRQRRVPEEASPIIARYEAMWLQDVHGSERLRSVAQQALELLSAADVPAAIVKGPTFADRLYPDPTMRPFKDIDLVVPASSFPLACATLVHGGFQESDQAISPSRFGYRAFGWPDDPSGGCIDLHWSLTTRPHADRVEGITWDDLDWEAAGEAEMQPSVTSLMLVATVQAALGPRSVSLRQLCDIRQLSRGRGGSVDPQHLRWLAERCHFTSAVGVGLHVAAAALADRKLAALTDQMELPKWLPWSGRLISRRVVIEPDSWVSGLRRATVHEALRRAS
jgi:hypothetical protein